MVWFVDECAAGSQHVGLNCCREGGRYILTVVDPGGVETRTTFDDEDAMIAEAVRLQLGLLDRGWRAQPRSE